MSYRAPVADMIATMRHVAGLDRLLADGLAPELEGGVTEAVLEEAAKFAGDVLAPLNRVGDKHGSTLKDGAVTTPPGWKEAYHAWAQAGWNALPGPEAYGGQGLPNLLQAACTEMWNSVGLRLRARPAADGRRDRGGACPWLGASQADLSRQARLGRVDGHDEPDRAAGGLRSQRAPHAGRAGRRRHLPHHRPEDLHHLWRARSDREHHPSRAGAPARCAGRDARHLALPGAEIPGQPGRHARRP